MEESLFSDLNSLEEQMLTIKCKDKKDFEENSFFVWFWVFLLLLV